MGFMNNVNVDVRGASNITPCTYKTVILKKNITKENLNVLTQAMLDEYNINTKFVIKWDYVLKTDIIIPNNCILEFDGGSISASDNNTIIGNNTRIKAPIKKIFSSDVILSGTFIDFCIDWLLDDDENDVAPFVTKVWAITNSIIFMKKAYTFRSEAKVYGSIYASDATFNMYSDGCLTVENRNPNEASISSITIDVKSLHGHKSAKKALYIRSLSYSTIKISNCYYFTQYGILIETGKKTIDGVVDNINREVALNTIRIDWMSDAPILINVRAFEGGWVNDNEFHNIHFAGGEYKENSPLGANIGMIWENPVTFSYNHNLFRHICFEGVDGTLAEFNKIAYSVLDFVRYEAGSNNSKILFKNRSHSNIIQKTFYDISDRIDDSENDGCVFGEYKSMQKYNLTNVFNANPISDYFEQFDDNGTNRIRPISDKISLFYYNGSPLRSIKATIASAAITVNDNNGAICIGCEINTKEFKVIYINHKDSPVKSIHVRYLEVDNVPVNADMSTQTPLKMRVDNGNIRTGVYNSTFKTFYFENMADGTMFVPNNVTKLIVYITLSNGNTIYSLNINGGSNDILLGKKHSGTTVDRPICGVIGFKYFDTTLGKPIYWNGTAWVDATGATV